MPDDQAAVLAFIAGVLDKPIDQVSADPAWRPLLAAASFEFEEEVDMIVAADALTAMIQE